MQKETKVFVIGGDLNYANWIPNKKFVRTVEEADLVFWTGGEDVSPSLYGQKKHPKTYTNASRDTYEKSIYIKAQELGKVCLGVCRGSQFLTSMQPDGMLVQHQENPGMHYIKTFDGKNLKVSSTHHQAQYPFKMPKENYKILGWTENMLPFHEGGEKEELAPEKECEVVVYPKTKCLGIQLHPEHLDYNSETNVWCRELLDKHLNDQL